METKLFEAEFLRRLNAMRIAFEILPKGIKVKADKGWWLVEVKEPIVGDNRKCLVTLQTIEKRHVAGTTVPVTTTRFHKPCTSYYLLQYIIGHKF